MAKCKSCPDCNGNFDFGEKCDFQKPEVKEPMCEGRLLSTENIGHALATAEQQKT